MSKNRDLVVPVDMLNPLACAPFSWAARHTVLDMQCN